MMSYLILFALIALVAYYGYSAFKIVKNFIDKKLKQRRAASNINDLLHNATKTDEQTSGE